MADTIYIPVGPDFDLQALVSRITSIYQAKGYYVNAVPFGSGAVVDFHKDDTGFVKYIGLAQAVKANFSLSNQTLTVNFSDAEWTGKLVGILLGWILCWIPLITSIIGIIRQVELPKSIGNDIRMNLNGTVYYGDSYNSQAYSSATQQQQTYQQPSQQFCNNCGAVLPPDAGFCPNCGTKKS